MNRDSIDQVAAEHANRNEESGTVIWYARVGSFTAGVKWLLEKQAEEEED